MTIGIPSEFTFLKSNITNVAINSKGDLCVLGDREGCLSLYNSSGVIERELDNGTKDNNLMCLAFHNDDKIICGYEDGTLKITDLFGKPFHFKGKHDNQTITVLCFINNILFCSGDDTGIIKVWDLSQSRCIKEYEAHLDIINDIRYEPTKNMIYSVASDSTITKFSLNKMEILDHSEYIEKEETDLTSLEIIENNLIVATIDGKLDIYKTTNLYTPEKSINLKKKSKNVDTISHINKISYTNNIILCTMNRFITLVDISDVLNLSNIKFELKDITDQVEQCYYLMKESESDYEIVLIKSTFENIYLAKIKVVNTTSQTSSDNSESNSDESDKELSSSSQSSSSENPGKETLKNNKKRKRNTRADEEFYSGML